MSIPKASETNTFQKIIPLIAFLFVLVIYLLFPTKSYYWDGIEFAGIIESASGFNTSLLHPNHLFYNTVGYAVYKIIQIFNPSVRAIHALQILNCIFGVLASVVIFFILKKLWRNTYVSLTLSLIFAFSATWWKFSTDANSYIPSVFFLLVSFYFLLPTEKPRPLAVALVHSLAMFFHQLALFFFPVAILGLILQTQSVETRKRIFIILQYTLVSFLLTFGVFCFSYYLLTGTFSLKEFFVWVTWFSSENGFLFNVGQSFILTIRSTVRLFFDGRLNSVDFDVETIILLGLLVVSFLAFLYKLLRSKSLFSAIRKTLTDKVFYRNPLFLLCVAWIVPYLLFLFFFIPGNTFYRLFYLPALILIFSLLAEKSSSLDNQMPQWRLALLVSLFFLANFIFFIRPYTEIKSETPLAVTTELNGRWNNKTVVFYDSFNTDNRLVKYFNPATVWVKFDSMEELEKEAQKAYREGRNVWIETSLIDKLKLSNSTNEKLPKSLIEKSRTTLSNKSYYLEFIEIAPRDLENKSQ